MNNNQDNNVQELIKKVLSNDKIKYFVKENNLTVQFYIDNFSKFHNAYDSLTKCENCKGLNDCRQDKIGEYLGLKKIDNIIVNEACYCPYYLKKVKDDNISKAFVYNDIPEYLNSLNMDNIELPDDVIKNYWGQCLKILNGESNTGIFVYGGLGVGKTYMCIALANSLAKKGKAVGFLKCNDFINEMRKLVINNPSNYDTLMKNLKNVDYLFMDDIGAETVSSYSRDDVLFTILDYRMENKLTTIFTSNLSKNDLLKHYTYEKNDPSSVIRAQRLMERIDILSNDCYIKSDNKRRIK